MKTTSKIPTAGVVTRPASQEAWQIVSQWIWNVRLELGHQLEPTEVRTTEFARAVPEAKAQRHPSSGYGKPAVAAPWKAGRFSGQDFALQPDGTVHCPADQSLVAHDNAEKPMEASVWCTRPASAVVAPALYATSANGKEMPRRNRGR